jgi:NTE family protein
MDKLEQGVRTLNWRNIFGYMDVQFNAGGLIQGEKLVKFVKERIGDYPIETLDKAFGAVATELRTGQEIWLKEGSLLDAVRASIALPGLLAPVRNQDRWLLDGGLVNPVPVSLCRAMGADKVIAVNLNGDIVGKHFRDADQNPPVSSGESDELINKVANYMSDVLKTKTGAFFSAAQSKDAPPGVFDVMSSAINIMQDRITRSRMAGDPPDVVLTPRLAYVGLFEFDRGKETIAAGWQEAERCMGEIKSLVNP